jgi:hypothetical protein
MLNKIKNAILSRLTFYVVYTPEKSENPEPVQVYKVIGHPSLWAWKTSKSRKVFTARVRNREERFRCFGFDRVGVVKFAWV